MLGKPQKLLVGVSVGVACAAIGTSVYFYRQYATLKAGPHEASGISSEVTTLVSQISGFMELPDNEVPSLATVSDTAKLGNNPFFSRAKNGDKILIYTESAKAILYRPSVRKIIEVSVFTRQVPLQQTDTSATPSAKKLDVIIRNGTPVSGAAANFRNAFVSKVEGVRVGPVETAIQRDYTDTIIIDLTQQNRQRVTEIAKLLDIAVSRLPDGEEATGADMLIIVGSDKLQK